MRIISNKQNSSALIKLPWKIVDSVVFKYFQGFGEVEK